jgi:two-component system osmolarity sensor histidine kinase EnvZ
MALPQLRSVLPRSLFARSLAILLVPIIVLQLVVGLVFFQRHYLRVTEQMTRGVAGEIAYAVEQIDAAGDPVRAARRIAELALALNLGLRLAPGAAIEPGVRRDVLDATGAKLAATFADEIGRPVAIDLQSSPGDALIAIQTSRGVLEAEVPRTRLSVSNPHQLLVLMIIAAILLSAVAVLFLRNQVRPIRALAEAAEAFGKGRSLAFRPAGAEEVRRAGAAFLAMRNRIERQIEQRTQMLSGVSHDLRTPLTRMKLTLALMDDCDDTRDLARDADQMERMLGEFLAFARGDSLEETVPTDPFRLAAEIAENARRAGAEVALAETNETPQDPLVLLRPGAVARAVQNLVGNAARHGSRVALQVRLLPKSLVFAVEDDGPGIPEAERARALAPFARLDAARNLDTGGSVGLGLSIALDVARSHGGSLELGQSAELGGLRAILRLPR